MKLLQAYAVCCLQCGNFLIGECHNQTDRCFSGIVAELTHHAAAFGQTVIRGHGDFFFTLRHKRSAGNTAADFHIGYLISMDFL